MASPNTQPWIIVAVLIFLFFHLCRSENYVCSASCICLRTYMECNKLGWTEVPDNFPYWVERLELTENNIEHVEHLQKLQKLKQLILNKNRLTSIPNLDGLNNLTSLSVAQCQIANVSGIVHLSNLRYLDLSSNRIKYLMSGCFPNNSALHFLNLQNNRISTLMSGTIDSLTRLEELKLNRNKISKFPKDFFKFLKQLKLLELDRNHFTEIEGLSFKGMENLETLKLRHNSITELLDGAFYELKKMSTLQLDYNNITSVTKGWLYGLSSLQNLSISHNQVNNIEAGGWEFCSELRDIDLSMNQLRTIDKSTFDHLPQLQILNLNGNKISYIAEGAFNNTPSLKILELSNNEISWTIEDMTGAFMSLGQLVKLGLASNLIKSINKKAFTGLSGLEELDVRNNSITSIQENAFIGMPALLQLHLNSSSLLCDCNLKWFPEWLKNSPFFNSVVARCAHPQCLHNMLITSVPVANFTCEDFLKPRLIEEPKRQVTLKGDNVTLVCRSSSSSSVPMIFQWRKDDVELETPAVHKYERIVDGKMSEQTSELQLFNISHNEAGKYQCIVSNIYGTTYSQKSKISVLIFPTFTRTTSNITLKSGSTAKLECDAEGEPKPQIAWQKDGGNDFPAARERRMHVIPADVIFFIVNVKPADMGVYSCTAQNEAGKIVANTTLTVLETPTFVKEMENKEISAGDSTVLECMAAGSPKPKLTWSKDGAPLIATPRHFFTAENQLLIIVNTALNDAGNYQCEMSNALGTERGSSRLTIIPSTIGGSGSDSVAGYIIISVVCCAVLTSVCWVLIIYQTRKRSSNTSCSEFNSKQQEEQQEVVHLQSQLYLDTNSEHSSGKDSGTGDSAQRSSDDLILPDFHMSLLDPQSENAACNIDNNLNACCPSSGSSRSIAEYDVTLEIFHPQPTNHERCSAQQELGTYIPHEVHLA